MEKYKVLFFTNVVTEGSMQETFERYYTNGIEIEDVADKVLSELRCNDWLEDYSNKKFIKYFRTSTVTDFTLKEMEENK